MEKLLLVLISLFLGYQQGIKKERKQSGKSGGIIQSIKDKHSAKGKIIQEQERRVFELQLENERLKSLMEEGSSDKMTNKICYKNESIECEKKMPF